MQALRVALFPFAKINFDFELACHLTSQFRLALVQRGYTVLENGKMITSADEARAAARELENQAVDLVLVFQSTFCDNNMILEVHEILDAPVFFWAVPEERTGGRLRLNSLCGVNLGSHALHRIGVRSFFVLAEIGDEEAFGTLGAVARAGSVLRRLKNTKLGLVGNRPDGMDTCIIDEEQLAHTFGVQVQHFDLQVFFERVRSIPDSEITPVRDGLRKKLKNLDAMDQVPLNKTLATYLALQKTVAEEKLGGLAVRCWPEFFTDLGCSACGALSMTINDGVSSSCEGDILGTIGQMILQWLSGEPAFGVDIVSVDKKEDTVALWHCGHAPLCMADPAGEPEAIVHLNRRIPLLLQFALKPGPVTIARFSQANRDLQLVVGKGEMLSAPRPFAGTSGTLRFDLPAARVLDIWMEEGLEHHLSFTYGNYEAELLAVAKMLKLPVLKI
jgi:L-fucose isomerase-like protein